MVKVQFKVTTWEEVEIEEKNLDFVQRMIKNGRINSLTDLEFELNKLTDNERFQELEPSFCRDVAPEQVSIEENLGNPTIEIEYQNDIIFDNVDFEGRNKE